MDEHEDRDDEDVVNDRPTHQVIPCVRVYVGGVTPDGDFISTDDLDQWLSQDGPVRTIVNLLESGIGSIYVTDCTGTEKVL